MSPTPLIGASLILSANKYKKNHAENIMSPTPLIVASLPYGVVNDIQRKPREMSQFGKKSAKEYHSLYSSTEQLQVAL